MLMTAIYCMLAICALIFSLWRHTLCWKMSVLALQWQVKKKLLCQLFIELGSLWQHVSLKPPANHSSNISWPASMELISFCSPPLSPCWCLSFFPTSLWNTSSVYPPLVYKQNYIQMTRTCHCAQESCSTFLETCSSQPLSPHLSVPSRSPLRLLRLCNSCYLKGQEVIRLVFLRVRVSQ